MQAPVCGAARLKSSIMQVRDSVWLWRMVWCWLGISEGKASPKRLFAGQQPAFLLCCMLSQTQTGPRCRYLK